MFHVKYYGADIPHFLRYDIKKKIREFLLTKKVFSMEKIKKIHILVKLK